jgi:hypothetical protein
MRHARPETGFLGAYFGGSTVALPDDAELPVASDVDVVVIAVAEPPLKLGKFLYLDTLLEVTDLPRHQLASMEVLTSYHLASSLRTDTIIADPTGFLRRLQTQVAAHFAERAWVRRRCENAHDDLIHRSENLTQFPPRLWEATEDVPATNPEISHQ